MNEDNYPKLAPSFKRLTTLLKHVCTGYYKSGKGVPVAIKWHNSKPHILGSGPPEFEIIIKDKKESLWLPPLMEQLFWKHMYLGILIFVAKWKKCSPSEI